MAEVQSLIFPSPGFLGLNREQESVPMGPEWATRAYNALIDSAGRFAARKGWVKSTTVAFAGNAEQTHEYVTSAGVTTLICTGGNKFFESSDDGSTWTDRTGAVAVTANNWQMVNFNSKVIAAQAAHGLVVKTAGNFALVAAATGVVPTNPVAVLSAFGRLWCVSADLQTIKYCALLDETKWAVADGGGTLDLRTVWTRGIDTCTAVASLGSRLIFFGTKHVLLYIDGSGSTIGIDPLNMFLEDAIEGTGTDSRDSIANIGEGDIYFRGPNGIRSLIRSRQEQLTPVTDLSKNNRNYLNSLLTNSAVDVTKLRAVYSPQESFYLLTVPGINRTFCFDTRQQLDDGSLRFFEWTLAPLSFTYRRNKTLVLGFASGIVGVYTGYKDNLVSYLYQFRSGFIRIDPDIDAFLKQLKSLKVLCAVQTATDIVFSWAYDFSQSPSSATVSVPAASAAEYAVSEYGIAEYGSSEESRNQSAPGGGSGQYFQVGIQAVINGSGFAMSNLTAFYTLGRLAK